MHRVTPEDSSYQPAKNIPANYILYTAFSYVKVSVKSTASMLIVYKHTCKDPGLIKKNFFEEFTI